MPLLREDNYQQAFDIMQDLGLPFFFIIHSKDHYFSLIHLFGSLERKYRGFEAIPETQHLDKFEPLVRLGYLLRKSYLEAYLTL